MKTAAVALQMYTLRKESERDFFGTLDRVAKLGFDGVELAGYGGFSPAQVKSRLDELGLQVAGNHVPFEDLQTRLPEVITAQKTLDCRYLVCPYLPEKRRTEAGYRESIAFLQETAEACKNEGVTLCYHNHEFELTRLTDGRVAVDVILQDVSDLQAEFDIYWLAKANQNPVDWINRYQGRTPLIHLKDITTDGRKFFAELGTGGLDLDAVMKAGKHSGVQWWVVEQDECERDPFESVAISREFLQEKIGG